MKREKLYFALFGAMGLLLMLVIAGIFYALAYPPPPNYINLGKTEDFPLSDIPYYIKEPRVWLTNIDGTIRVFDPLATYLTDKSPPDTGCLYSWVEANMRFEDPCAGSKYLLDGTMVDIRTNRDLDQYVVTLDNGFVYVDLHKVIVGKCRHWEQFGTETVWTKADPPPLCDNQLTN